MTRTLFILALARRFRRDRDGATAVEFALIAGPFFALILAILEVSMVFFTSAVVEDAVLQAARDIRTGRIQNANATEADFRSAICARLGAVADCGGLSVDVRVFEDFSSVALPDPVSNGDFDDSGFTFEPGDPGEVVVVRAFYPKQLYTPSLAVGLANMDGNKVLLSAATAFRNEPYSTEPPGGGS